MMKRIIIILFMLFCVPLVFGDTFTNHLSPKTGYEGTLDVGTLLLPWGHFRATDGTFTGTLKAAEFDFSGSDITTTGTITGETFTDGIFTVTGGIISSGTWQGDIIAHEYGGLEADVSDYTNGLYGMVSGITTDIDTSSELLDIMDDETGTGVLVFGTSPTFTTDITITGNSVLGLNSSVFQPTTDSTTFFQVLDAAGASVLNVNTTNTGAILEISQLTDAEGIKISGFDDQSDEYVECFVDSTGNSFFRASAGKSLYFDSGDWNVFQGRAQFNDYLLVYDDKELIFGTDLDMGIMYRSATDDLRIRHKTSGKGVFIDHLGHFGINVSAPETPFEIRHDTPYITLWNSTHEDTDGGGESRLIFKREDGAGTKTACAQIEASHDGVVANDQLGKYVISVNTGAGLAQALEIGSDLLATFAGSISLGTNPATSGILRIPNSEIIYGRNAANDANYRLLQVDASDQLALMDDKVLIEADGDVVIADGDIELNGGTIVYDVNNISADIATFETYGLHIIDSSGAGITGTLAAGTKTGQSVKFVCKVAGNDIDITVSNHVTSDPEVIRLDTALEYVELVWDGTDWVEVAGNGQSYP